MSEIWKDVVGYEGYYQVSNLGNVKSIERTIVCKDGTRKKLKERILKQVSNWRGYLVVELSTKDKGKIYSIHRLVAQAFIPNPENKPQVNHKDENKNNNCVENLEWCDNWVNSHYGTRNERIANYRKKKINQYDLEGNFIKEWASIKEVKEQLGYSCSAISACVIGRQKTAYGYVWGKDKVKQ